MKLKRIVLPAFVGSFAIVSGFISMPIEASSQEIEIEYVPLDGAAVEATNELQWHPPMIDPDALPTSLQVDQPSVEQLGEQAAAERELAACRSDVRRAGVAASGDAVGQTLSLLARAGFLVKGRMPGKDIQHVPPGPWEENGFEEKNPKQPLPAVSYAPAWDLEEMNASVSVIAEGLEDARASVADLETLLNGAVTKPELNVRSRQSRWLAIAKGNRIRPTKMCSSFLRC